MFSQRAENRLQDLIVQGEQIKSNSHNVDYMDYVDSESAYQWVMSALTILKSSFGEDSDHYVEIKKNIGNCGRQYVFAECLSYVKAAVDDLKGGYFFEKKVLIEAEVFGDLLDQSKELLASGYKDAAAALIGGVLETHLRSMCTRRGIGLQKPNGKPKTMNDFNDDLARANAYNALKKKQITAWADLRNKAAHGLTADYSKDDVEGLYRDVSAFCASIT